MSQLFRSVETYTIITPFPSYISRQLALEILHRHGEVIKLNPLVLDYKQVDAPRDAPADEYFSTWYEITERVQFVPGMGKFGSGKISFKACFHDLPWGLQTHVYAPLNIDMLNKYYVGGNQPGEEKTPAPPEIGLAALGVPKEGLYLREDIEIRCNIAMVNTVKKQMKKASEMMVARIITLAGLPPPVSSPTSPFQAPRPFSAQYQQINNNNRPGTSGSLGYPSHWQAQQQQHQQTTADNITKLNYLHAELPSNEPVVINQPAPISSNPGSPGFPMELPGDFYYPPQQPQSQPPPAGTGVRHSVMPDIGRSSSQQLSPPPMKNVRPNSYSSCSPTQTSKPTPESLMPGRCHASSSPPPPDYYNRNFAVAASGLPAEQRPRHHSQSNSGYAAYNPADYAAKTGNGSGCGTPPPHPLQISGNVR
jgi:hypothetical protein